MTMQSRDMGTRQNIFSGKLVPPLVFWLILIYCSIEAVLFAADMGFVGTPRWRLLAYQNGAFWAGLLYNWRPNYTVQPWLMFLSYSFLHGGITHLLGNMITLFFLGRIIVDWYGNVSFLLIYFGSAIGGAVTFGLLTSSPQPMIGASGALSGLVGAFLYREWHDRKETGLRLMPVWLTLLSLVILTYILWWAMNGLLAWETHLGGTLTGCVIAAVLSRRNRLSSTY